MKIERNIERSSYLYSPNFKIDNKKKINSRPIHEYHDIVFDMLGPEIKIYIYESCENSFTESMYKISINGVSLCIKVLC